MEHRSVDAKITPKSLQITGKLIPANLHQKSTLNAANYYKNKP
jgi:hypothetical protein